MYAIYIPADFKGIYTYKYITLEFVKNMAMRVLLCIIKLLSALFSLKRKEL